MLVISQENNNFFISLAMKKKNKNDFSLRDHYPSFFLHPISPHYLFPALEVRTLDRSSFHTGHYFGGRGPLCLTSLQVGGSLDGRLWDRVQSAKWLLGRPLGQAPVTRRQRMQDQVEGELQLKSSLDDSLGGPPGRTLELK